MDPKKKEVSRKLKKVLHESSSSSSSTSSSNSDTGSSTSSSSPDSRHKLKRRNIRKRKNSSSSEGHGKKPISKKHLGHKKPSDVKKVVHKKSSHPGKIRKKVVPTHVSKKVKSLSPVVKSSHKHLKLGLKKDKMLVDPNDSLRERERELLQRDREKLRLRENERRSLSPRTPVRRLSPRRDIKKDRTPERRVSSPSSASRYRPGSSRNVKESPLSGRRHETTKERERRDREAARDKERAEALARCQERQRERDRKELRIRRERERSIEEEKPEPRHKDRLLPRPSERVRMLNATRNSPDKMVDLDRSRSHSRGRSIRDRLDKDFDRGYIAEHRERSLEQDYVMPRSSREDDYIRERKLPRDEREYEQERIYESQHREERRLAPVEYVGPSRSGYEERHRREPDWEDQERSSGRIYERLESRPEWDREVPVGHHSKRPDDGFKESRGDWNRQWNDPQDKWAEKREPKEWPKYGESLKPWNEPRVEHPSHVAVSHGPSHGGPIQHSAPRRWPTQAAPAAEWTGSIKSETEYRRPMHPHTPKMIGEHGAPATAPHPFKRHSAAHSNPFHYNYKRFHFNKRHQQSTTTAPVSPSLLTSPGKVLLKTSKVLINAPSATTSTLAEKGGDATIKKQPQVLVTSSEMDKDASSEGIIDTTTEDAEKSIGAVDEEQEDNLSEFSDVDDEILNREEELAAQEAAAAAALVATESNSENGGDSKSHANQELKKEMDLDFEEISDGELEEEAKRHCLADALGVDWASLAKETQRPIEREENSSCNSIKTRWTPHRIMWDVGVSAKMAGEEFAIKVMTDARDKLRQERLEKRLKRQPIKKEITINGDEEEIKPELNGEIKQETAEIKKEMPEEVESEDDDLLLDDDSNILLHPLANLQVHLRKMKVKRRHLIMNATGKYGRALSSHNDLKIRRQLCNLPAKEIHMDRNWRPSAELNAQVQLIYQRLVAQVG